VPITVLYGASALDRHASTARIDTTTENTFVHTLRLTGLEPGREYRYRAVAGKDSSRPAAFRTAPAARDPFRFCWFADCRSGTTVHDRIAALILTMNPAVSLYGGDLCFNDTYTYFKSEFFRPAQRTLIASVPFFNAVGNHEKWSVNTRAFTRAPASTSGTEEYYSFDYGCMHVLVLNTEIDRGEGSPQFEFARRDLAATQQPWKIVIAHKPAYVSGGHRGDKDLKKMSTSIFRPNGVQILLAGHSHFYQHNLVDGIHHFVIGSAGAPLYPPTSADFTVKSLKEFCFGIGDVEPARFRLTVFNENRDVLDSLTLTR
jgi:predicted phosphodiesterase